MKVHGKTDIGAVRSSNQDAFITGELGADVFYAVVCDGMGGANAGNVASSTAAKIISEYILSSYRKGMDSFEVEKMLKNAIVSANIEIYSLSLKDAALSGMGTTVVAALLQGNSLTVAHAGDSRAYKVSDKLYQLTRDHSVVQTLIESGKITPEDAKVHPRKNVITKALGVEENIIADSNSHLITEGEALLLCTDGLSGYAEESEILEIFKNNQAESVPDELIKLANSNGGGDNITAVVFA